MVERVPVPTDGPGGATNAYLVGAVLVDPGSRADALDAALADREVTHVAVTHSHPDHVEGVAGYAEATGATVWGRRGYEARFEAAAGRPPDRTFAEGDSVGPLTVLDVPGHAPDHVAFETAAGVLVGDVAVAEGSVAVAAPDGAMGAYMVALRRLHARDPPRLFPGHGPVIDDPRATLARLYDHRRERERRVRRAVEDGAGTVDAVLAAAYDKDLTGVRDLAYRTVRAHLEHLDAAGWVRFDRETGRVAPAD